MNSMTLAILQSIVNFFKLLGTGLGYDNIVIIGICLFVVLIIASYIRTSFTLELRSSRAINKLIYYLEKKPYVTEENIVEFNKLMKKVPKTIRYQWQKYMLNRENKPSDYISQKNCIENPLRTSGYKSVIKYTKIFTLILAGFVFLITLGAQVGTAYENITSSSLLNAGVVPSCIIILGFIYAIVLNARLNAVVSDLYYNFSIFEKFLDRAVESMPEFVDYEILFTKKEIADGIPALQEYLEQRAKMEEEMLQRAKESEVEHDKYNFGKLGVNGSLVMERALKESEYYLGNRRRIMAEVEQITTEKEALERNYDEKLKGTQRKLRDIREELQRLQDKAVNTTNKILANDIRKQQVDETRKQQVLEAEMDEDEKKYLAEIDKFNKEIDERKKEIDSGKKFLEKALISEFEGYSTKVYDKLKNEVAEEVKTKEGEYIGAKQEAENQIADQMRIAKEFETLYNEKCAQIGAYEKTAQDATEKLEQNNILVKEVTTKAQEAIKELNQRRKEFDRATADLTKFRAIYDRMVVENKEAKAMLKNINDVKKQATQEVKMELQVVKNSVKIKDKEIIDVNKQLEVKKAEVAKLQEKLKIQEQKVNELQNAPMIETYRYFDNDGKEFYLDREGKPYHIGKKGQIEYFDSSNEVVSEKEEGETIKENKKPVLVDKQAKELDKLQKKIEKENARLKEQHEQLTTQITQTLDVVDSSAKKVSKKAVETKEKEKKTTKKTTKK